MGMKVSIIVPAYNVEKYVGRCLNSILQQSYPEFEVICVDDASEENGTFEELKRNTVKWMDEYKLIRIRKT